MAVMRIGVGVAFFDAVNVKFQGAVGDGVTDDTAAIQACIDLAFGSAGSPHGTSAWLNKPLYFPAGQYKITSPLYIPYVVSGYIFGDGCQATQLTWAGSYNGNNVTGVDQTITPLFMTRDGFSFSRFENMTLNIGNSNSTAFWLRGTHSCNGNVFANLLINGATYGMEVGFGTDSVAVSENLFINVVFANCPTYGLRNFGANVLNNQIYGGGGFSCGVLYSWPSGSISILEGIATNGNTLDIDCQSTVPFCVVGGRSESADFMQINSSYVTISGFQHDGPVGGKLINFSGSSNVAILDGVRSTNGELVGQGTVHKRGGLYQNANYLANYTGTLYIDIPPGLVSALPAASVKYKGVRAMVTDANATTFMSTVAGSGSNIVPVVCDGANWKIG